VQGVLLGVVFKGDSGYVENKLFKTVNQNSIPADKEL
jgi:hypothetical protein